MDGAVAEGARKRVDLRVYGVEKTLVTVLV